MITIQRRLLLTLCLFLSPFACAQGIIGSTIIDIDPATNVVTVTCETDLDGDSEAYYRAVVYCVVNDTNGNSIAGNRNTDTGGLNGYAQVVLTFQGVPGTTYFAEGMHSGQAYVHYYTYTSPYYVDHYNFYALDFEFSADGSTPDTSWDEWFGQGPPRRVVSTNFTGGATFDVGTVPYPCPTSVTINSLTPISITSDSNLRTGYGAMASMRANPPTTDWSSAVITETITPGQNSCPNPGSIQPPFQTVTLANSSTFPIGQGSFTFDYPQSQVSFPAIPGAFYDEHSFHSTTQALGTGSCVAFATQTYVCGGNTLGTFTITKTFTAGTANGGPATIVTVTKQ